MKTCFKCLSDQPLTEFYAHPSMADGHLNKCKTCTKSDMRIDRATNPRVRAYDRERASQPHRAVLRANVTRAWRAKHPERAKAQAMANDAMRDGQLTRPKFCEGCGLPNRIEKHHPDYSKPLLVMWLCKTCHAIADKVRRKLEVS